MLSAMKMKLSAFEDVRHNLQDEMHSSPLSTAAPAFALYEKVGGGCKHTGQSPDPLPALILGLRNISQGLPHSLNTAYTCSFSYS